MRQKIRCLTTLVFILAMSSGVIGSTDVSPDEETYILLERLSVEGVIKSSLLGTKPLSRKEIARLIREAEANAKTPFTKSLINSLKKGFIPEIKAKRYRKLPDRVYVRYIFQDEDGSGLSYNNNGDVYSKGSHLRIGILGRAECGLLSFLLNPEFRYSDDGDLLMKRAYVTFDFLRLELMAGKDSMWWGPGYHGSILLSNNSKPMTMLRLSNTHPVLLPWVFKYLGPFRFNLFVSQLEKQRDVPRPYLWGLRFNFKPVEYLELGLQRTALLGGEGRKEDPETWLRSLAGRNENEPSNEAGDQRAGFDVKVIMPFRRQPLQLYLEGAGEDSARGLPYKWAYLSGMYLPRILSLERVALRAEYATTHVKNNPNVWYNHNIYSSGYTYKGSIIGHHMGTDSEDIFLEMSYHMPEKQGRLYASYDRERHNLSGNIRQTKDEASLGVRLNLKDNINISGAYTLARLKSNAQTENINLLFLGLNYYF